MSASSEAVTDTSKVLESLKKHNEPIPPPIDEGIVEIAVWVNCQ